MLPLPTPILMEALLRHRRREHNPAAARSALTRRPHRVQPLQLRLSLALALQAPVARLDPLGLGAGPRFRPIRDEPETAGATDPDSHQSDPIVA
jgi:hypothetical protein